MIIKWGNEAVMVTSSSGGFVEMDFEQELSSFYRVESVDTFSYSCYVHF